MWKYKRGSIEYDILVILILLFIFLTPKSCFEYRAKINVSKKISTEKVQFQKSKILEKKDENK